MFTYAPGETINLVQIVKTEGMAMFHVGSVWWTIICYGGEGRALQNKNNITENV